MASRLVTVKGTTVRVSPSGLKVTGADTALASERLAGLLAANNGKHLREDAERQADRGAVLAIIAALVRLAPAPVTLAEARQAYRAGTLVGGIAPREAVSTGAAPSAVNMATDRDAKAFGADGFTVRAFDAGDGRVVLYVGPLKG